MNIPPSVIAGRGDLLPFVRCGPFEALSPLKGKP